MVLGFWIVFFQFWMETVYLEEFPLLIPSLWKMGSCLVYLLSHCQNLPIIFFFLLAWGLFVLAIWIIMSFTEHVPHLPQSPMWGCASGKTHSPRQHQGYMFGILMLMFDYFIVFCLWVFVHKITTCPGTGRTISLTTAWLTLQSLSSFRFM